MKFLVSNMIVLILIGLSFETGIAKDTGMAQASEENALWGRVNQRGLYRMVRSGGVVDDPETNTGKIVAKPVIQLVESTERIPLIKGAQMYLQYRIRPLPDRPVYVDFTQVLKHPEMTLPDGSVSTGSVMPFKGKVSVNQAIGYIGYGFDEDYELLEGEWVFEVWYQDKKLLEQKFTTYWPDKEERATLVSRLAPSKRNGAPVPPSTTPLAEKDWPMEINYDITDNPAIKDVVTSKEP